MIRTFLDTAKLFVGLVLLAVFSAIKELHSVCQDIGYSNIFVASMVIVCGSIAFGSFMFLTGCLMCLLK